MSNISRIIEEHIMNLIKQGEGNTKINRNELAIEFHCAPSQINYVLTTRFTSNRGFVIESRRGGGGYIRIIRVDIDTNNYIKYILSEIGETINKESAQQLVEVMYKQDIIDKNARSIINTVVDDSTLSSITKPERDKLRSDILKSAIIAALVNA